MYHSNDALILDHSMTTSSLLKTLRFQQHLGLVEYTLT